MEASHLGLISQVKGNIKRAKHWVVTVFVYHFSGKDYIHLQTSTSAEETVEYKEAFEGDSAASDEKIKQYWADNGRFS